MPNMTAADLARIGESVQFRDRCARLVAAKLDDLDMLDGREPGVNYGRVAYDALYGPLMARALRRYADDEHHLDTEHSDPDEAYCTCGVVWVSGDGGCTERARLLACADTLDPPADAEARTDCHCLHQMHREGDPQATCTDERTMLVVIRSHLLGDVPAPMCQPCGDWWRTEQSKRVVDVRPLR